MNVNKINLLEIDSQRSPDPQTGRLFVLASQTKLVKGNYQPKEVGYACERLDDQWAN